jgi:hypothetical protein
MQIREITERLKKMKSVRAAIAGSSLSARGALTRALLRHHTLRALRSTLFQELPEV